jgi:hypothetical protein
MNTENGKIDADFPAKNPSATGSLVRRKDRPAYGKQEGSRSHAGKGKNQ